MKEYKVENHESSFLPDGEWELAWADEFDGTELDETKWDYRTAMMGREHPAWTRNGVTLDGKGNVVFSIVMESFEPRVIKPHNVFTGGYGLDMQRSKVGGKVEVDTEEFHRFGLLWDETGYTFYIDGKEDGKITEKLTGRPEFILISTEVHGYRYEDHQPTEEAYEAVGDTFVVDYVRVFDKVR